jgi:hypothetical protein
MKHRLTITLIGVAVLATSGYWAIKNNIGKSKHVTAIVCKGENVYSSARHEKFRENSFHSTASILVTAEYYPWETNKTYSIDYKNGGREFQGSTNDKSVGNADIGDGVYVSHSVNQHNIQFFRRARTTHNNDTWTKKETYENWRTSSSDFSLMINLITMEIKVSDNRSSLTMKENSSVSSEYTFQGNCTVTHPNFKI